MAEEHYSPSGRGPELIAVYSFFSAITTITFFLRVFVRVRLVKDFGLDDWTAAAGWMLFNLYSGFAIAGAHHGTGQHADLIPPTQLPIGLKYWWACEPLYVVANMAVKLSIALMLLRIVLEKSHRALIYAVTITIQIFSVVFFFLFVFQCTSPSFFWTRFQGVTEGSCMNPDITVLATYVYSAITVVCDWTMAMIPWLVVRKLQMDTRTKIMVAIVLGMGSIASIATIVRIPYIASLKNIDDFLYSTTDVAIWSCIETGLSIAASCAATLKPLFRKISSQSLSQPLACDSSRSRRSRSTKLSLDVLSSNRVEKGRYIRTTDNGPGPGLIEDCDANKDGSEFDGSKTASSRVSYVRMSSDDGRV